MEQQLSMLKYNPNKQMELSEFLNFDFIRKEPKDFKIFPIDKIKNEDNYVKEGEKEYLK